MPQARALPRRIDDPPSMTVLVADALRALIVSGGLAPGDRLIETQLAEQFGVSRPPLREAMALLAQEGLIVHEPRRGAHVRRLTVQDAYEIVTLRGALERLALGLGVPVVDERRQQVLDEAMATLESNAAAGAEDSAVEDTLRLHTAVVALAGHDLLDETYQRLSTRLRMCMSLNREARAGRESLVDRAARHRRLYDAVVAGDRAAAIGLLDGDDGLSFLPALAQSLPSAGAKAQEWFRSQAGSDQT